MTATNWTRLALVVGLAIWTIQFARTPIGVDAMSSFLHLPDLVFHEAGHIIFSPFGSFMMSLGGSLTQLLIPLVCAVEFVRRDDWFGAMAGIHIITGGSVPAPTGIVGSGDPPYSAP